MIFWGVSFVVVVSCCCSKRIEYPPSIFSFCLGQLSISFVCSAVSNVVSCCSKRIEYLPSSFSFCLGQLSILFVCSALTNVGWAMFLHNNGLAKWWSYRARYLVWGFFSLSDHRISVKSAYNHWKSCWKLLEWSSNGASSKRKWIMQPYTLCAHRCKTNMFISFWGFNELSALYALE